MGFYDGPNWQTQALYQIRSRQLQPLQKYERGTRIYLGASLAQDYANFFRVVFYYGRTPAAC